MKILCFIDSLGTGGAQRQMVELAKGFKEKGHEVSFLTYHSINFFKPELDKHNIAVKTIVEHNYLKRLFKIRRAIRDQHPDAVLSFLEAANFMATLAGLPTKKWKLVVGERNAKPDIHKNIKKIIYRFFHLFSDYVVANSNSNLESVLIANPILSKKQTKVIYNIVDFKRFEKSNSFFSTGKVKIVIAASYFQKKNLDGLINAISLLPKDSLDNFKVDWYGSISENNSFYIKQLNKIKELGLDRVIVLNDKTTEIKQKYQEADFVGLFSHYEGFPNTICEAMAMGKPVIVSKVSDVPLFIKEDVNGFLCDSQNPETIKEAIIKAIQSTAEQREKMGKNNYITAREVFNRGAIVEAYLKLLSNE